MSELDWADKIALNLMDWHWHAGNRVSSANQNEIAAALRAVETRAWNEAVEAAAKVADKNAVEAWNDNRAPYTRGLMRLQADDIAKTIRSLRKEQP